MRDAYELGDNQNSTQVRFGAGDHFKGYVFCKGLPQCLCQFYELCCIHCLGDGLGQNFDIEIFGANLKLNQIWYDQKAHFCNLFLDSIFSISEEPRVQIIIVCPL